MYMSSEFGRNLRVSIFGESHGPAIGVTVNGFPAGEPVDFDALQRFMARRAPGNSPLTTARKEADLPEFLSGIKDNILTGRIPNLFYSWKSSRWITTLYTKSPSPCRGRVILH